MARTNDENATAGFADHPAWGVRVRLPPLG